MKTVKLSVIEEIGPGERKCPTCRIFGMPGKVPLIMRTTDSYVGQPAHTKSWRYEVTIQGCPDCHGSGKAPQETADDR